MTIAIGDVLRVVAVLVWTDGDVAQNVFNAIIAGAGGPFTEADIVDDALDWVETMYATLVGVMSDEIDGSEVRVYVYDGVGDDWDEIGSEAWVFNPTATADQLPRGVAGLINAKTSDADVSGKKYLPASTESDAADGLWNVTYLADLVDFGAEWLPNFVGAVSGATWDPGIWSPTNTELFPASGTAIIPTIPAYQRRRKRGIGI